MNSGASVGAGASTGSGASAASESSTGTGAELAAWAVPGIGEISPGDDLASIIGDALESDAAQHLERTLLAGDVLVVTSKILSKAEGRIIAAADREQAITDETVRTVATRAFDGGVTRIVENRQGVVGAAAGVDASNVADGHVLLLPLDPDASARALCAAWRERFGVEVGVIVSDTLGRAWRLGQTDIAIGAAGVRVLDDLRGQVDASGKQLAVTQPAVGDELAALGDLVKGKASGYPVAVVRGAGRLVTTGAVLPDPGSPDPASLDPASGGQASPMGASPEPFTTARSLSRTGPGDMFRLGTDEALAEGYARGLAAGLALAATTQDAVRWNVVVPFKGGPTAKSRLAGRVGAGQSIARAFLLDTVAAIRAIDAVERIFVVSADQDLGIEGVAAVADPGGGLNAAVAAGVAASAAASPGAFTAVLVGDLPTLRGSDLAAVLAEAVAAARSGHPLCFVPDRDGTGTTAVTVAPGAAVSSRFGPASRRLHGAAGFHELAVAPSSTLRLDVDDIATLEHASELLGPNSSAAFAMLRQVTGR